MNWFLKTCNVSISKSMFFNNLGALTAYAHKLENYREDYHSSWKQTMLICWNTLWNAQSISEESIYSSSVLLSSVLLSFTLSVHTLLCSTLSVDRGECERRQYETETQ